MSSTTDSLLASIGAFVVLLVVAVVGLNYMGIPFGELTPRLQTGLVAVLFGAAVYLGVN